MGGYIDSLSDSGSGSDNEEPRPARAEYPFLLGPSPKGANARTSRRPTGLRQARGRQVQGHEEGRQIPLHRGFKSKHDHGSGMYGFGSGPPVSHQERGGNEGPYKPADMGKIEYGKAPGPPTGRVEELDDDGGAPGGSGGWGPPGAPGGSGGGSGGGDGPAAV